MLMGGLSVGAILAPALSLRGSGVNVGSGFGPAEGSTADGVVPLDTVVGIRAAESCEGLDALFTCGATADRLSAAVAPEAGS